VHTQMKAHFPFCARSPPPASPEMQLAYVQREGTKAQGALSISGTRTWVKKVRLYNLQTP